MKIIITVKDTAKLSRIEELGRILNAINTNHADHLTYINTQTGFDDVIESIDTEW